VEFRRYSAGDNAHHRADPGRPDGQRRSGGGRAQRAQSCCWWCSSWLQ